MAGSTQMSGTIQVPAEVNGDRLVTVKAQVMRWDETYNGWMPHDGGGVSNVTLYQHRRPTQDDDAAHSSLRAQKSTPADSSAGEASTSCVSSPPPTSPLNRASSMPTPMQTSGRVDYSIVARRCTDNKMNGNKYGLSFVCNYDACRFANRLQRAIEHLRRQSQSVPLFQSLNLPACSPSTAAAVDSDRMPLVPNVHTLDQMRAQRSASRTSRDELIAQSIGADNERAGRRALLKKVGYTSPNLVPTPHPAPPHQPPRCTQSGRANSRSTSRVNDASIVVCTTTWPRTDSEGAVYSVLSTQIPTVAPNHHPGGCARTYLNSTQIPIPSVRARVQQLVLAALVHARHRHPRPHRLSPAVCVLLHTTTCIGKLCVLLYAVQSMLSRVRVRTAYAATETAGGVCCYCHAAGRSSGNEQGVRWVAFIEQFYN
ncbi:unnamed protein product [Sphagnum balticum]